jgi:RNase P subunit RPR2
MELTVKAEYIRKILCEKCYTLEHDENSIRAPSRKVVQNVRGVFACTGCGRRVSRGYVVVYESTGI